MRKVSGLVGAALLLATPAFAADLPVKAPVMPLAPVVGWTGFYVGGNVGVGWGEQDVLFSGDPNLIGPLIARGVIPSSLGDKPTGTLGGVQAGYNWQTGSFLLGIETDIDAAHISSGGNITTQVGTTTWTTTANKQLNYLGTARGRLGFTITPSLLVYGTGGFAYGGAEMSSLVSSTSVNNSTNCTSFCGNGSPSTTLTGWAAGGGLEYMVTPNWSIKAEYLHYDLGTLANTYGDTARRAAFASAFVINTTEFKGNIARLGANYKF